MKKRYRSSIEFALRWKSSTGSHCDRIYSDTIDFWRDIFPGTLATKLGDLEEGMSVSESFKAGELVPEYTDKKLMEFPLKSLKENQIGVSAELIPGRFYPRGLAWKPLNSFRQDMTPFRVVSINEKMILADINHPLSLYPLTVEANLFNRYEHGTQRGGSCNDIGEIVTKDGPGMQVNHPRTTAKPIPVFPLKRQNEKDDKVFYKSARLVHHLDSTARRHVQSLYEKTVRPGSKILDLMSSWTSHLPDSLRVSEVIGVGLNEEELSNNKQLSRFLVHDLNNAPLLPFEARYFDAVICTVSFEYLTRPIEILSEISRVLRDGGRCIIIISDRWFPGKQVEPWQDLHPFERQGMILDFLVLSEGFSDLQTESIRGYPRPEDDEHLKETLLSDPLYVVMGTKKEQSHKRGK